MKSKPWIVILSSAALLSGCVAASSYCDVADPLYFDGVGTIDWLSENDVGLLRGIVVHNEQHDKLCR